MNLADQLSMGQRPELTPHYSVELDRTGQVHIRCKQGKDTTATIGLSMPGFKSLIEQGLMRKPRTLEVGALHNWVQLNGELFSFEKGNNDANKLERALNERFVPTNAPGFGKEVVVTANAASATGFDIQFPLTTAGSAHSHKSHLNEEALELLGDSVHCGLLHKEIVIKLIQPNLVFKQRTADGGERYLVRSPDHLVRISDEDGNEQSLDLSQPLNCLHLNAIELTAVFNHPAINRHVLAEPPPQARAPVVVEQSQGQSVSAPAPSVPSNPPPVAQAEEHRVSAATNEAIKPRPEPQARPRPNLHLKETLAPAAARQIWSPALTFERLAAKFGNPIDGRFGWSTCRAIQMGPVEDISEAEFKGIFLTEKGSLGFLSRGRVLRFQRGVVFVGTRESAIEGIGIHLLAVGLTEQSIVFVVTDSFRSRFGVPLQTTQQELQAITREGALVMDIPELLSSPAPIDLLWTAAEH
jgi:hypothetical protein